MSKLSVFNFNQAPVRVVMKEGEPWFVAKDLCQILEINNVSQALTRLEDDEKNHIKLEDKTPGNPNTSIVSESGMYVLVMSSRKPGIGALRQKIAECLRN